MVVDVIHPTRANVSKDELRDKLSAMYKSPKEQIIVFGFRTHFGGGRSTGFALIYDSPESLKFEPRYRLVRVGSRFLFLSAASQTIHSRQAILTSMVADDSSSLVWRRRRRIPPTESCEKRGRTRRRSSGGTLRHPSHLPCRMYLTLSFTSLRHFSTEKKKAAEPAKKK
jgi:ribosomal protein S24E